MNPPAVLEDALLYFESLEGMFVSISDGVVVGPTNKYGEFVIVRQHVLDANETSSDGRYFYNPYNKNGERIIIDDATGIRVNVKLDDIVENMVGVLDYNYANYKVDVTEEFRITPADLPEPILAVGRKNVVSIATFNLENFFDTVVK